MPGRDALERLRRPEYTGSNRCMPCTVVNAVLAVLFAVVVAFGAGRVAGRAAGAAVGLVVLVLSAASISLRGYLVPGTPWITRTYFPDRVLRWFEKAPPTEGDTADATGAVDVEAVLSSAGAVEPCDDADDLCLTESFEESWRERVTAVREEEREGASAETLARVLDLDPNDLAVEARGDALVARVDGGRVGQWESRAAYLADVAAAIELRDRLDGWSGLDGRRRGRILYGLRLFLDRCPDCDGRVTAGTETVESCCRSVDVVAVSCRDCGARLFEMERPDAAGVDA